jgi:hypothetical protein
MIRQVFVCTVLVIATVAFAFVSAAEPSGRAEPAPTASGETGKTAERAIVPMTLEGFRPFIGNYQREDMIVRVFSADGHFYLRVDDRERAELFPLSDHEFFLKESPDKLSFERNERGGVTHFIRHSTAPQLFRRLR